MLIQNAEIRVVNAPQEGRSKSTGLSWQSQEIVIAWLEVRADETQQYNYTAVRISGADAIARFAAAGGAEGVVMDLDVRFRTRSIGSRLYIDNVLII